jgi:hypothetical protein
MHITSLVLYLTFFKLVAFRPLTYPFDLKRSWLIPYRFELAHGTDNVNHGEITTVPTLFPMSYIEDFI